MFVVQLEIYWTVMGRINMRYLTTSGNHFPWVLLMTVFLYVIGTSMPAFDGLPFLGTGCKLEKFLKRRSPEYIEL